MFILVCHSAYLTYMQSTSCKMAESQAEINIAWRNINNLRYAGEAWCATVHGVAKSRTRLSD